MADKIAYDMEELLVIHPGGRTRLYDAIGTGQLVARKNGRRTIVLHKDYIAYLEALPRVVPKGGADARPPGAEIAERDRRAGGEE